MGDNIAMIEFKDLGIQENIDYWLWLSLKPGMNASKMEKLMSVFHSPEAIFNMSEQELLKYRGLDKRTVAALADKSTLRLSEVKHHCKRFDIYILTYDSPYYPENLRHISSPPYVLYTRSSKRINLNEYMRISVVGNRVATDYGIAAAENFGYALASNGFVVVSGMALGIDGASHRGALKAEGGITVAVLGSGLESAYPKAHQELMREIMKNGMLISEYPPYSKPEKWHFPERNRIISGLSQGTLVVEAPKRSGSLITANYALEEGRDIFALPGNIDNTNSEGTNNLIKDGAYLVTSPRDIVEHYSFEYSEVAKIKETQKQIQKVKKPKEEIPDEFYIGLTEEEKLIITKLSGDAKNLEVLQQETKLPADKLASLITMLEIKGKVKSHAGKNFTLNTNR